MKPLAPQAIEARSSSIHGSGVYARVAIAAEAVITEYTGEIVDLAEAERRERDRQARAARGEEHCDYLYIVDDARVIDGRDSGNVARLINHACEPNCFSEVTEGRVWIVAGRDIAAGEELSFDYGYPFRDGLGHPCRCGASSCVGFIVARHQRWRVRRWREKRAKEFEALGLEGEGERRRSEDGGRSDGGMKPET